jgi:hypothetical protein
VIALVAALAGTQFAAATSFDSYESCDCTVVGARPGINMWKGSRPCGNSAGTLANGRCLNYAPGDWSPKTANCGAGTYEYVKMVTSSGKSTGWYVFFVVFR